MVEGVVLTDIGKRFNGRWLFRHLDISWQKGDRVAIIGANGSGKSSLTRSIAGYLTPTEGTVVIKNNKADVEEHNHWKSISWTSPALLLPEQLSYCELFLQVEKLRGFHDNWSLERMEAEMGLEKYRHQPLKSFSSGMRQRVKLILAFAIKAEVLILDEPTAHLDRKGVEWFSKLILETQHDVIFVASNSNDDETFFCNKKLDVVTCVPALVGH
jgi:ABC-type multidrug transport system ATPase subunit